MTDNNYLEEQRSEIEILQSIYPTEFTEISENEFSILIDVDDSDLPQCTLSLVVKYTETYPDELPEFRIVAEETEAIPSIDEDDIEEFVEKTRDIGTESLGMAMVFNMAMNLKELASQRLVEKVEQLKLKEEERIQKEIEADQKKFIGTRVTRESFLEWKEKFDDEMAKKGAGNAYGEQRYQSQKRNGGSDKKSHKLTGRQLFEQDRSLAQSDSTFIKEGDVSVDTSLFENEDLSEDDDDDSDSE